MFTALDLVYTAITGGWLGFFLALALFYRPKRRAYPNGTALRDATPYHSSWPPDAVVFNEVKVYPSIDVWARETGAV